MMLQNFILNQLIILLATFNNFLVYETPEYFSNFETTVALYERGNQNRRSYSFKLQNDTTKEVDTRFQANTLILKTTLLKYIFVVI